MACCMLSAVRSKFSFGEEGLDSESSQGLLEINTIGARDRFKKGEEMMLLCF